MSNVASSIYKGAIHLEKGKTLIGAICGTLIGICILIMGIYMIRKKSIKTEGVVKSSTCSVVNGKSQCDVSVEFLLQDGKSYTSKTISSKPYVVNEKIMISYNPDSPDSITLPDDLSSFNAGMGFISCSICLISVGWIWYYVTNKYESVAAVQAVGDSFAIGKYIF